MSEGTLSAPSGFTRNGLPYNRKGSGPETLVVFPGLSFKNAPMQGPEARMTLSMYSFLSADYTLFSVGRRPRLPAGFTIGHMADDYAEMIEQEFHAPVDVIGLSTGGSICQQFAADHPDLLRKLVIHSAAYTLGPQGKDVQLRARDHASRGQRRRCVATMMEFILPKAWYRGVLIAASSGLMALSVPKDASDFIITIDAEDRFDFRDRLGEIAAPTLLVAGTDDPGYSPELFRETADGVRDCRLALYPGMGHPARGPQFERDVLEFLRG